MFPLVPQRTKLACAAGGLYAGVMTTEILVGIQQRAKIMLNDMFVAGHAVARDGIALNMPSSFEFV